MRVEEVPLLVRREIEARLIAPFVDALAERFGREAVLEVLAQTIERLARRQGEESRTLRGHGTAALEKMTETWKQGGALELTVLRQDPEHFDFNVTRCRYAEMYQRLGIPELGRILSCGRDFAVAEGLNAGLQLQRTQTILQGDNCCDFRFRSSTPPASADSDTSI